MIQKRENGKYCGECQWLFGIWSDYQMDYHAQLWKSVISTMYFYSYSVLSLQFWKFQSSDAFLTLLTIGTNSSLLRKCMTSYNLNRKNWSVIKCFKTSVLKMEKTQLILLLFVCWLRFCIQLVSAVLQTTSWCQCFRFSAEMWRIWLNLEDVILLGWLH